MKPTEEELNIALKVAREMRNSGDDPDFIAKSLIYLRHRDLMLEQVLDHLELFLRFGLPVEEHAKLVRLVSEAKAQERIERGETPDNLGL